MLTQKDQKTIRSRLDKIYEIFCNSIQSALVDKKNVEIRGFGTFFVKEIKEKFSARNPKTGEKVNTPEKRTIQWKMAKDLFKKINNEYGICFSRGIISKIANEIK